MTDILKYNHSILILYEILYEGSSIEFVSEFIKKIKKIDKESNSSELKEKIKKYLDFLTKNEFIYIEYGNTIFDMNNLNDFFYILDENWDKFENKNNPHFDTFWYSYLIEYTDKWKNSLRRLKYKPQHGI